MMRRPGRDVPGVTLLGGAGVAAKDVRAALQLAPVLVCADGGANSALTLGLIPDRVIGDMDSISPEASAAFADRLVHVEAQDSTDFEKCLSAVAESRLVCVGFTGRRIDHELAVLACVARTREKRVIVLGEHDVCFRAPSELALRLREGDRISLFPFSAVRARSRGLRWPLDGLELSPSGTIGTSNRTCGREVELFVDSGDLLVLLPRAALHAAAVALGFSVPV